MDALTNWKIIHHFIDADEHCFRQFYTNQDLGRWVSLSLGGCPIPISFLKRLVKLGADLNYQAQDGPFSDGTTVLHRATSPEEVQFFQEQGFQIEKKNSAGFTPLAVSLLMKKKKNAQTFIALGADLTARVGKLNSNLLHLAARADDETAIDAILKAGIDINATNDRGETPLHIAAYFRSIHAIELLIERGADRNAKDHLDRTPLHFAASHYDTDQGLESFALLVDSKNTPVQT